MSYNLFPESREGAGHTAFRTVIEHGATFICRAQLHGVKVDLGCSKFLHEP